MPVSELLVRWCQGDDGAADAIFAAVYPELKKIARRALGRYRPADGLATTELVHEAFVRIEAQRAVAWQNREQLLAIASMMMRRAAMDDARFRNRVRRGRGAARVELTDEIPDERDGEAFLIGDAIERLREAYPRSAAIVTMRFFGGMSVREIATALGVSTSTVAAERRLAIAWLRRQLSPSEP